MKNFIFFLIFANILASIFMYPIFAQNIIEECKYLHWDEQFEPYIIHSMSNRFNEKDFYQERMEKVDGKNALSFSDQLSFEQLYQLDAIVPDFRVNENIGNCPQYSPSIDVNDEGSFVVTWCDYRNGDPDIFAQRFSEDGTALGQNFRVNNDQCSAYQRYPAVSINSSGEI